MDFSFSEEQNLLRNSVNGLLSSQYDFETRRKTSQGEVGMRPEIWTRLSEMGLLALPFDEAYGGLGGDSHIETMIIMEEIGRFLVTEPYLPTVILAGGLLNQAPDDIKKTYLPDLAQGKSLWALAAYEPQGRFALNQVKTKADKNLLSGHKSAILGGAWADYFIVSARLSGQDGDEKKIGLFIVDKKAKGVEVHDYRSVDGSRVAELVLDKVPAILISEDGFGLLTQIIDRGIAALCAESCGAMGELHSATIEYCKTRKQFGVPIGSFQVLQHQMVDMLINYQEAISMSYMAHLHLDAKDKERARAVSAAKAQIGQSGRFVGQSAVQLHGGMGVTDELNVGHFFKRLSVIDGLFGNVDFHTRRYIHLS